MNPLVGDDQARARCILNCELGLAGLARQPPNAPRHVLPPKRLPQCQNRILFAFSKEEKE